MTEPHSTWFISFAKFSFPGLFAGPVGSPKTCAEQQWFHSLWMCMSCCTTPEVWKEKITIMCRHFCRCVLNSQTSPAVLPQFCIASATDRVCEVPLPSVMCGSSSSTLYSKALLNWPLQSKHLDSAAVCLSVSILSSMCMWWVVCLSLCIFVCGCECRHAWLRRALGVVLAFFLVWDWVSCLPLDTSGWLAFELQQLSFLLPPCGRNTMITDAILCPGL